jgi:hypothetical protein
LDEALTDARLLVATGVPDLEELAPLVAVDDGFDHHDAWDRGLN